jgi:hypothetical protein
MAFQIFLIPSLYEPELAIVWQLQTLAQAYDMTLKTARRTRLKLVSSADAAEIHRSDAVVVIATRPLGDHSKAELQAAQAARKPIYWLMEQGITNGLKRQPANVVLFNRDESIHEVAERIHRIVAKQKSSKEARTALGWLLGIGAALFILDALVTPDTDETRRGGR